MRIAVMISVLLIAGAIALIAWLVGSQVTAQSQQLAETLPRAAQMIDARLAGLGFGHPVSQSIEHVKHAGLIGADLKGFLSSASLSVASFLIVFFGGIFLAAQPELYGIGAIKLIPSERRALVGEAMTESDRALRLWLKGQLWAMILIFVMTWAGLWLLGVPSALVLALISGVLEFIPYAGAITSAIPAIMVALVQGPELALWVVGLYVVVHHVEAYLIQPVIQQFAVEIPAVITLFALLAFDQAERYLARPKMVSASLFVLSCIMGWLSHITFTHVSKEKKQPVEAGHILYWDAFDETVAALRPFLVGQD